MSDTSTEPGSDPSSDSAVQRHSAPGLQQPAQISIDQWGVPHITAASARDAYFVQGWNAARDRLWQIDLWRKRGLGMLAESFGPGYLAQDRAARLFLYRGDMAVEWAAYGTPDTCAIATAFAAGVNAYIGLTELAPDRLPPEFALTGSRPARWQASDVVTIRSHALGRNLPSEFARARVLAAADLETDLARRSIDPPHRVIVPDGVDWDAIGPQVLDQFQLAVAPVGFSAERLAAGLDQADAWTAIDTLGEVTLDPEAEGSNNWVVAGERSVTGRPLMASDPHRAYTLPSTRYVAHLRAPGLDVIGAGEPNLPGLSLGHNTTSAFSLTTFPVDQEDLYVYRLHPDDDGLYRYVDDWEPMRSVVETVPVKGAPDQQLTLRFTRHGPVIHVDLAHRLAYAVRTVWSEPGSAPYLASLAYQRVASLREFETALESWSVPSNNHVYADIAGDFAWITAGKAPLRPNWDGLLPVPGDGRYEWAGYQRAADLPRAVNPASGYVSSANDMNLPPGPARELGLGFEWNEPFRGQRIREVLGQAGAHSLDSAADLQSDTLSIPARQICALLPPLTVSDATHAGAATGMALLRQWNYRLDAGSAAALVFEVWWMRHLKPALLARFRPDPAVRRLLGPGDHETMLSWLQVPATIFGDNAEAERDACLLDTLSAAIAECRQRFGPEIRSWAWSSLHHGYFSHPLTSLGADTVRDIGPLPLDGSGSTVLNTTYRTGDGRAHIGASFRMLLDVGAWDNCRFVNGPGQSGDPRSPHYDDHAAAWSGNRYFPLLYSSHAIEAATVCRIVLVPETGRCHIAGAQP